MASCFNRSLASVRAKPLWYLVLLCLVYVFAVFSTLYALRERDAKEAVDVVDQSVDSETRREENLFPRRYIRKQSETNCEMVERKRNGRMVVIGDSLLSGVEDVFGGRGVEYETYPGARIVHIASILRERTPVTGVEAVYVHVGTEDLSLGVGAGEIETGCRGLLTEARRVYGDARVVMGGVVDRRHIRTPYIDTVNNAIARACWREGARIVRPRGRVGEGDLGEDGLHLSREGCCRLGRFIEEVLGGVGD